MTQNQLFSIIMAPTDWSTGVKPPRFGGNFGGLMKKKVVPAHRTPDPGVQTC